MHCYFFDSYLADYLSWKFAMTQFQIGLAFSAFGLGFVLSGFIAQFSMRIMR